MGIFRSLKMIIFCSDCSSVETLSVDLRLERERELKFHKLNARSKKKESRSTEIDTRFNLFINNVFADVGESHQIK